MHSEDRKEPYKTLNRTNNIVQKPREKWPKGKKRNTLTRRSPRKVVKNNNTHTTKTESLRTDSLVKKDFSKVPKRSAHNKKQSY